MPSETEISLATVDPTWKIAARVWWSWWWRTTIVSLLLSFFLSVWIGMFMAPGMAQLRANQLFAGIVSAIVGLYFFKDVLDRKFKNIVCASCRLQTTPPPRTARKPTRRIHDLLHGLTHRLQS